MIDELAHSFYDVITKKPNKKLKIFFKFYCSVKEQISFRKSPVKLE